MKLLALGDIHGRDIWKKIVEKEPADQVTFIGDYFDSHEELPAPQQLDNFRDLLEFKNENPDKVVLLIGNHDYHYLNCARQQYSNYQHAQAPSINKLLQPAVDQNLLQACYSTHNIIFTHAGITQSWAEAHGIDLENPATAINNLFKSQPGAFDFTPGRRRDPSGDDVSQTPFWVRPRSLLQDKIPGYTQVVGHTIQHQLKQEEDVFFIDALGTSKEYLYWDEKEGFSIRSVSSD